MEDTSNTDSVSGNTNDTDELPQLSMETIRGLNDLLEAFDLAESHNIDLDGLDSLEQMQKRMRYHLTLMAEGNLKEKFDGQIKESGLNDVQKKDQLSELIKEVKGIFEEDKQKDTGRRLEMLENLLNIDGTTENIRQDCDLRIASLKEKECAILVQGQTASGTSSLPNLLLGEELLPVYLNKPYITVIKYGSKKHARVIYKSGETITIPELDKQAFELLRQIGIKEHPIWGEGGHDVAELQVYLPHQILSTGLVLIEIGGLYESEFLENHCMDYIKGHQILGVIFTIKTDSGLLEDRVLNLMRIIVKSQDKSPRMVKFNPKAALFVCNRWDLVESDLKKSVREEVLKQLGRSWPDFDASQVVFISIAEAKNELSSNKGYISDEFIALLSGLLKLIDITLDERILPSYSWIETVLRRTVHYLKTIVRQLDMGDIERPKKTQQVSQKLQVLKGKADGVISSLYEEVEKAVEDLSHQVRLFLQSTHAQSVLTKYWRQGELPDMWNALTWEWVKQHIENAFNDRLTDLLIKWDETNQVIPTLEKRLFRKAKLQLCELESELLLVEDDVQQQDHTSLSRSSSSVLLDSLHRSIEDDLIEQKAPRKLVYRLKQGVTENFPNGNGDSKLQGYKNNPDKLAQTRSEELLHAMLIDKDKRLEGFIKDLLLRPYNYIRRLESKIYGLINSNMTLLEQFQRGCLEEMQYREQYTDMLARIEQVRRNLIEYDEASLYVNDFEEKDIMIFKSKKPTGKHMLIERMPMVDYMNSSGQAQMTSDGTNGIWHTVHPAEIRKGSETQNVTVKIYIPEAIVGPNLQEVAKLRCLLHTDVCIAEMLGVFQQKEAPTAAIIFSGHLMSLRQYTKTTKPLNVNTFLQETLTGLQYIHSKGLVHMELLKDTITLSEIGEVKLTGCCLPRKPVLPDQETKVAKTMFACLAPEVLRGEVYQWFADMYAFALLTIEVKNPDLEIFDTVNETSITELILLATAAIETFETKINSLGFSKQINDKLLSCLNKEPSQRTKALDLTTEFRKIDP